MIELLLIIELLFTLIIYIRIKISYKSYSSKIQIFLYRFMNILIPEAIEIVDFKALFNVRLC